MSFDLSEYVDVAERIAQFYKEYPTGSLKTGTLPQFLETGGKAFVVYHAQAFRTPDDPCPADGWAWEPVPGPTQFTKDSELQNAETAAWGRAIVALGFETKKIASRQEVQNRSGAAVGEVAVSGSASLRSEPERAAPGKSAGEPNAAQPAAGASGDVADADNGQRAGASASPAERARLAQEASKERRAPNDNGRPSDVRIHFGKNGPKGDEPGKRLGELSPRSLSWYAMEWNPGDNPVDRRLKMAAQALAAGDDTSDFDIPF